jgi:glutamate synthase domain-containing protein 1
MSVLSDIHNGNIKTVKQAKEALALFGMSIIRTKFSEYKVNFKGAHADSAYYTTCLTDACQTGIAMVKQNLQLTRDRRLGNEVTL